MKKKTVTQLERFLQIQPKFDILDLKKNPKHFCLKYYISAVFSILINWKLSLYISFFLYCIETLFWEGRKSWCNINQWTRFFKDNTSLRILNEPSKALLLFANGLVEPHFLVWSLPNHTKSNCKKDYRGNDYNCTPFCPINHLSFCLLRAMAAFPWKGGVFFSFSQFHQHILQAVSS